MATACSPVDHAGQAAWPGSLKRWALALVIVGVAWRTVRYLLQFPIWGDEAFVCLNLLDRHYLDLLQPLRFQQVAPILFLWSELAAHHLLGGSELALRLIPFLTGLGTLLLFWRLARLTLPPLAEVFAVGILAVAYYPVRHCCEVKPYALDLFLSLLLLVLAVSWLKDPRRLTWLVLLALLVPLALAASYPTVFVAGAVSLVLLPAAWRQGWPARWLYLTYNLAMVAAFVGIYSVVGRGQFTSTGGTGNGYWDPWFPPSGVLSLLGWLVRAHTGNMLAYPVGGPDGASTLTLLLCAAGAWQFWRSGRRELVFLCLVPFGLTFLAAALHRYPYGGSARIAQHLAPAICLLAGMGAASLLTRWLRSPQALQRAVVLGCSLLILIGVSGTIHDCLRPYKTKGDREVERLVAGLFQDAGNDDQVVVVNSVGDTGPTFEWYLRQHGDRVAWDGKVDEARLSSTRQLWFLRFSREGWDQDALPAVASLALPWSLVDHSAHTVQLGRTDDTIERCEVFHWVNASDITAAAGTRRNEPANPFADLPHR